MSELLTPDELAKALAPRFLGAEENRPIRAKVWLEHNKRELPYILEAQLAKVKQLYPIMYQEEADMSDELLAPREEIIALIKRHTQFTKGEYSPLAGSLTSDTREMWCQPSYLADQILAKFKGWKSPKEVEEIEKCHQERLKQEILGNEVVRVKEIEEAKKQERERILALMNTKKDLVHTGYHGYASHKPNPDCKGCQIEQALKEGEK